MNIEPLEVKTSLVRLFLTSRSPALLVSALPNGRFYALTDGQSRQFLTLNFLHVYTLFQAFFGLNDAYHPYETTALLVP
jgi:hypothetical protein